MGFRAVYGRIIKIIKNVESFLAPGLWAILDVAAILFSLCVDGLGGLVLTCHFSTFFKIFIICVVWP